MATPYDTDLDRNPANFQPLTPLSFLERAASVFPDHTAIVHGPLRRSYAEFYARARRLASALAQRGIGRGDTVSAVLANTPAMLECHYGVPMTGAVLNTINTRLDAAVDRVPVRSRRDQGADHRPRVLAGGEGGARARQGQAAGDRLRRSGVFRRGRAARHDRVRGFHRGRRSGFRLEDAGRRMGRDRAQLHLRHHRRSQGRGLSPPRRLSARDRQRAHLRDGPPSGLSLDAADVPLQRLVLSVDDLGRRRHACLPARGARARDVRRHRHAQGDASVRRADRDGDAAQRAGGREEAAAAHRRIRHRRRAAARGRARRHEGGGLQRHPRLRPDRDLRPRHRQRMAPRAGTRSPPPSRPPRRRARACATCRSRRSTCSIPRPCSRCRATARRWAR